MDNTLLHSISIFKAADIEIPFKSILWPMDSGSSYMKILKAPIVAVNIWYHVGAKNEKPGKSGFAHLFEHLMFNGGKNFNTDYFSGP